MQDCVGVDFNAFLFQKKQIADGLVYWSIIGKDTEIDFPEDKFKSLLDESVASKFDSNEFSKKSFLEKFIYLMELNEVSFHNINDYSGAMNFDGDAGFIWDVIHEKDSDILERFNKVTDVGICCQLSYSGLVSDGDAIESIQFLFLTANLNQTKRMNMSMTTILILMICLDLLPGLNLRKNSS